MRAYLFIGLALAGCVDKEDPITGVQSLKIDVLKPTDRGSFDVRKLPTDRDVEVNVTALDADGQVVTDYNNDLGVYVHFLGTLSPYLTDAPYKTVHMVGGKAMNQMITLPPVFGPTTLWFDDSHAANPTFATGISEPIWFEDPAIYDIQHPRDEMGLDALEHSVLELKQIDVHASRFKADGLLVVNSVFAQGYTVSDLRCPGGHAPCDPLQPYDSIEVFSFSAPRATSDEDSGGLDLLAPGQIVTRFNGGVSEFNGLTEIGFPRSFIGAHNPQANLIPGPKQAQFGRTALGETDNWFGPLSDPEGIINFERYEAAPISIADGVVCALDDDYTTFKQWKIDPNGTPGTPVDCSHNKNVLNLITTGITDLDPTMLVGKKIPKVVGIVRPVNIGTFNVWIIFPRDANDLQLP